jgi:hypothetical protein
VSTLDEIKATLVSLDIPRVQCKSRQCLGEDLSPATVLEEGLIAGMNIIGQR